MREENFDVECDWAKACPEQHLCIFMPSLSTPCLYIKEGKNLAPSVLVAIFKGKKSNIYLYDCQVMDPRKS